MTNKNIQSKNMFTNTECLEKSCGLEYTFSNGPVFHDFMLYFMHDT